MTAPAAGSVPAPAGLAAQVGRMLKLFAPQLAAAPVLFFVGVTFLHESAHAVMAIALGGTIKEFAFLPGEGALGHVRWEPPPNAAGWMSDAVSVAPYLMWSMFAAAVILLAVRRVRLNHWLAAATSSGATSSRSATSPGTSSAAAAIWRSADTTASSCRRSEPSPS